MLTCCVRRKVGSVMLGLVCAALGAGAGAAETAAAPPMSWVTLGTAGGPVVRADRSQPANLLLVGGRPFLVDAGDGAAERLAAAGFDTAQVSSLFISHLHVDHIGGLQAIIGLRWMNNAPLPLTVYGPPGTDEMVAGIVQSLQPTARTLVGNGKNPVSRPQLVKTVILKDGSDLIVDGIRVRTVENSHFADASGPAENGTLSLSYRFDSVDYSIGYTGDTGPSDVVARLEKGVDVLVSEVIDLDAVIAILEGPSSPTPAAVRPALIEHLKTQHLTAREAGALANAAGARHLVLTHLGTFAKTDEVAPGLLAGARQTFKGTISVAHDLEKF